MIIKDGLNDITMDWKVWVLESLVNIHLIGNSPIVMQLRHPWTSPLLSPKTRINRALTNPPQLRHFEISLPWEKPDCFVISRHSIRSHFVMESLPTKRVWIRNGLIHSTILWCTRGGNRKFERKFTLLRNTIAQQLRSKSWLWMQSIVKLRYRDTP